MPAPVPQFAVLLLLDCGKFQASKVEKRGTWHLLVIQPSKASKHMKKKDIQSRCALDVCHPSHCLITNAQLCPINLQIHERWLFYFVVILTPSIGGLHCWLPEAVGAVTAQPNPTLVGQEAVHSVKLDLAVNMQSKLSRRWLPNCLQFSPLFLNNRRETTTLPPPDVVLLFCFFHHLTSQFCVYIKWWQWFCLLVCLFVFSV